jgi:hypothetical protein
MAKKLKAVELFLSLGMVASLATACGGPAKEGAAPEADGAKSVETAPDASAPDTAAPDAEAPEAEEGGEGGEG